MAKLKNTKKFTNSDLQNMSVSQLKELKSQLTIGSDQNIPQYETFDSGDDWQNNGQNCKFHQECPDNYFCHSGLREDGTYWKRFCAPYSGNFCEIYPCGPGDGDCDDHNECGGGMNCGVNNCGEDFYEQIKHYEQAADGQSESSIVYRTADCCTPLPECGDDSPYPANSKLGADDGSGVHPGDLPFIGDNEYSGAVGGPCMGDGRWNTAWSREYHDYWTRDYTKQEYDDADGWNTWNVYGWRPVRLLKDWGTNKKEVQESTGYTDAQLNGNDGGVSQNSMYAYTYFVPKTTGSHRFFADCDDGCTIKLGMYLGSGDMDKSQNWEYYNMHTRDSDEDQGAIDPPGQSSESNSGIVTNWAPYTEEGASDTWWWGGKGRDDDGDYNARGNNSGWKWTGNSKFRYSELFDLEEGQIYRLQVKYYEWNDKSKMHIMLRDPDMHPEETDLPFSETWDDNFNQYITGGIWKYGCCDDTATNYDDDCDNKTYDTYNAVPQDSSWGVGLCICKEEACAWGIYERCCNPQHPNHDPECESQSNCECDDTLCISGDTGTGRTWAIPKEDILKKKSNISYRRGGRPSKQTHQQRFQPKPPTLYEQGLVPYDGNGIVDNNIIDQSELWSCPFPESSGHNRNDGCQDYSMGECNGHVGNAGNDCYLIGNPVDGEWACVEVITVTNCFCGQDTFGPDECHTSCSDGSHVHSTPGEPGDCDYSHECTNACFEHCYNKNELPMFMDQTGTERRTGGKIEKKYRKSGTPVSSQKRHKNVQNIFQNPVQNEVVPTPDSHLADCYEYQDIAMNCHGTVTTSGGCSGMGDPCCMCAPTGMGYFSYNEAAMQGGVAPNSWFFDTYYDWNGGSSWDSFWLMEGSASYNEYVTVLDNNLWDVGQGSMPQGWDIWWNSNCYCMFTCNQNMNDACFGNYGYGARGGYHGQSGVGGSSGTTRWAKGGVVRKNKKY